MKTASFEPALDGLSSSRVPPHSLSGRRAEPPRCSARSCLMADACDMANGLKPYHLKPPSWREPWLARDELGVSGFPQFFPTHAGQEEDCMSEAAIKSGYSSRVVVPSNVCRVTAAMS